MKKVKTINWNSRFELKIEDKVVPKSNIKKLIEHAIGKRSSKPVGMKMFYKSLVPLNIPKFIIVNKVGRKIMKKVRSDKNVLLRHPGKLDKS